MNEPDNTHKVVARRSPDGLLRLQGGSGAIYVRYVERSREKEVPEPDENAGPDAVERYEREHPRVEAEIFVSLPLPCAEIPPNRFVRLAYLYSHDSYDGEYALVLEDGHVCRPVWDAIAAVLGEGVGLADVLRAVAPHAYREGIEHLASEEEREPLSRNDNVSFLDE